MARRRIMQQGEADLLCVFLTEDRVQSIKESIKTGQLVQVEESEFSDPEDYVKILVNGETVGFIPGY